MQQVAGQQGSKLTNGFTVRIEGETFKFFDLKYGGNLHAKMFDTVIQFNLQSDFWQWKNATNDPCTPRKSKYI